MIRAAAIRSNSLLTRNGWTAACPSRRLSLGVQANSFHRATRTDVRRRCGLNVVVDFQLKSDMGLSHQRSGPLAMLSKECFSAATGENGMVLSQPGVSDVTAKTSQDGRPHFSSGVGSYPNTAEIKEEEMNRREKK